MLMMMIFVAGDSFAFLFLCFGSVCVSNVKQSNAQLILAIGQWNSKHDWSLSKYHA